MGKKLYICRAETAVLSTELEYSRAIGAGQLIDLEETVGKIKGRAVKLRDLVRADCFEELEDLAPEDTEDTTDKDTRGK